ncbi:MAG: Wadjet anti-phage system protein JetD domain-containing protein [Sedimenticola sp.]
MKSPAELRGRLKRQWLNGGQRQQQLLDSQAWPLLLPIGKPSAATMSGDTASVRQHIQQWRGVTEGEVEWQPVNYRSTAEAVDLPVSWRLNSAEEWIASMSDASIRQEYRLLSTLISAVDQSFHPLIVRHKQLLLSRSAEESIRACQVALALKPGCAAGRPLRALSVAGCDSKFFERNRTLLVKLLAVRFGSEVSEQGLEQFLGALDESEHWLLVVPLASGLLPFRQQRVRSSDLAATPLPGSHLLIVENERSLYQLPPLPDTLAILGAGLNLSWLQGEWISNKEIAYWGDIDTWGLTMLATARSYQPTLTPLLMDQQTFEHCQNDNAVIEQVTAGQAAPSQLNSGEADLYYHLLKQQKGRLEQEFIPEALVNWRVEKWYVSTTK